MLRTVLLIAYSWFSSLLLTVSLPLFRRHRGMKRQLAGRLSVRDLGLSVAQPRAAQRRCFVFFCSSGGEYEQAKPLIERLQAAPSTYVQILFFSQSGLEFARARAETAPCALFPLTDSVFDWGSLFTALRPDAVVVVRYELWPGFLDAARHFAKVYLIDASCGLGESRSWLKRRVRASLLGSFDHIFAVSAADATYLARDCGVPQEKVAVTGDTKYDRVRERALARRTDAASWRARWALALGARRRLIIGSAHPADVTALVDAIGAFPAWRQQWQVIIAPHHLEAERLTALDAILARGGVSAVRYTSWLRSNGPFDALILDTMGMLAEVYGACDAALVGGAMHYRVHNVLEPACHGLALAFGPFYKNSQEAVLLVNAGHAAVVKNGAELAAWWQGLQRPETAGTSPALQAAVEQLCGASDKILAAWRRTDLDAR